MSDFAAGWKKIASPFKWNKKVIFDIINEPHDIPASTAFSLNQTAVNAIRATGGESAYTRRGHVLDGCVVVVVARERRRVQGDQGPVLQCCD